MLEFIGISTETTAILLGMAGLIGPAIGIFTLWEGFLKMGRM